MLVKEGVILVSIRLFIGILNNLKLRIKMVNKTGVETNEILIEEIIYQAINFYQGG